MRKYLLIAVAILIGNTAVFPQNFEARKRDSVIIDSMIKIIPIAKDTSRISFLNKLSRKILYSAYPIKTKTDLALPYVETAYKEAKQAGYIIGIVKSLDYFEDIDGWVFQHNRINKIDNTETIKKYEAHVSEFMEVALKLNDAKILGDAYEQKAGLFQRLGKKKEKLDAIIMAANWYKKSGNELSECTATLDISYTYLDKWEFENAFDYCKRALELAKKIASKAGPNDESHTWLQLSLSNMAEMYRIAGDFESALNVLREIRQFHILNNTSNTWGNSNEFADIFLLTNQIDSAYYYSMITEVGSLVKIYNWPRMGDLYFLRNQYDSAFYYYDKAIDTMKLRDWVANPQGALARSYYGKARVYEAKKQYTHALSNSRLSNFYAAKRMSIDYTLNNYNIQSRIFRKLGKNDSAYIYLNKYMSLKDSILNRQFLFRISNYKKEAEEAKKEAKIGFLNRDNKIKEQQLKQEATFKYFLIAAFIALVFAGLYVFRNLSLKRKNEKLEQEQAEKEWAFQKLESEKKQAELHHRAAELEMQSLRAQMNPHFIFNCLSSINRIIMKNDSQSASDYLTRFSRLMRMVLINSQRSMIPLEDELQMLRLYLDMERLRFKDSFNYSIIFTNTIDEGAVFVPPLLLQPFCENAIWHGLMQKDGPGLLTVELSMQENILSCIITDNGIGREKAEERKSKSAENQKSMGLKITTERLALLNREKGLHTFYEIDDLKDEYGAAAGTKVVLRISVKEIVEETA